MRHQQDFPLSKIKKRAIAKLLLSSSDFPLQFSPIRSAILTHTGQQFSPIPQSARGLALGPLFGRAPGVGLGFQERDHICASPPGWIAARFYSHPSFQVAVQLAHPSSWIVLKGFPVGCLFRFPVFPLAPCVVTFSAAVISLEPPSNLTGLRQLRIRRLYRPLGGCLLLEQLSVVERRGWVSIPRNLQRYQQSREPLASEQRPVEALADLTAARAPMVGPPIILPSLIPDREVLV